VPWLEEIWIAGAASSRDPCYRDKNDSRLEAAPTMKLAHNESLAGTYAFHGNDEISFPISVSFPRSRVCHNSENLLFFARHAGLDPASRNGTS
jgi:hypothetical protein